MKPHSPLFDSLQLPPGQLIEAWPEVFDELYMNTLPLQYVDYIDLHFGNNSRRVLIKEQLSTFTLDHLHARLLLVIQFHANSITSIGFRLNIANMRAAIDDMTALI